MGWPSRSLQHVRFQSCSFVSSPGLRLETDQQRYSSRGERPSSSAGEQETISQQESRKHAAIQKTRRRKGWNLRGRGGPTRGLAHQVSKLSIANLVRLKQGSSLFLFNVCRSPCVPWCLQIARQYLITVLDCVAASKSDPVAWELQGSFLLVGVCCFCFLV